MLCYCLRLINLREDCEGRSTTDFISALLVDVLQDESSICPPELDAAYRVGRAKPAYGQRSRPIVICFTRCKQREQVLALAKKRGQLFCQGCKIYLFPDMSRNLANQYAAFNEVKSKLYKEGITFTLRFPAVLAVTVKDAEHQFNTPEEAEKFINSNMAK